MSTDSLPRFLRPHRRGNASGMEMAVRDIVHGMEQHDDGTGSVRRP